MNEEIAIVESGIVDLATNPHKYVAAATTVATALATVIKDRGLFVPLEGRKYVTVEGWTLLANMLGVHPIVVWSRPCTDHKGGEGWESRVEVRNRSGEVIGAGEAMCTRSEVAWGGGTTKTGKVVPAREDFALRGMAQTRAVSRALRNPLGFVVKLAGYEVTPSEEMSK